MIKYTSLPPVDRMLEILEGMKDDANASYDPDLRISAHTYKAIKEEYSEDAVNKIDAFIKEYSVKIEDKETLLHIRSFDYVHFPYDPDLQLPQRATQASAGYDLYLPKDIIVTSDAPVRVCLGVKANCAPLGKEWVALIIRSKFSGKMMLCNSVGVIDADYADNPSTNGELQLTLLLFPGEEPLSLEKGTRIAQAIFLPYEITMFDTPKLKVRSGGHGSTGD